MPRPKKNNMDYFSHDNGMRNDRKIKALRAKYGIAGYAVFNMFLELLCENDLLVVEWSNIEVELIASDFGIPVSDLKDIMDYILYLDLLQMSNEWVYCRNLDKRSESVFDKRLKDLNKLRINRGIKVHINGVSATETPRNDTSTVLNNTETPHQDDLSDYIAPESTQSKVKYSKVNKSKVKENKEEDLPKKSFSAEPDIIDKIINEYCEAYGGYEVLNRGKERQAAGKLLNLYKKKYPDATTDEALTGLRAYFEKCIQIDDAWMNKHMSIPLIVSKFNEINKIIQNGQNGGATKSKISLDYRQKLLERIRSATGDQSP